MRFLKLLLLASVFLVNDIGFAAQAPLGSHNRPLRFAIVPSGHATTALDRAKPVISCIEKDSGYFISLQIPNSYVAVAEAMGSNKVDLAFGDISVFLIARKKYNVQPFLKIVRFNLDYYKSMVLVRADSDIKTFKDLNDKKFAYPDASSASGYLLPIIEMKKQGMKFSQELPTGSMEAAVIALMQKKVDATAAFYNDPNAKTGALQDARYRLQKIYPDIAKQTRIIWTSSEIPNEPIFVRQNLPEDIRKKLLVSIPKCFKQFPGTINSIEMLEPVSKDDKTYDDYLKMLEDSGLDIAKVFSKEKK